ncbi:putative Prohormone-3 [Hypsibius exemplaris]|uniref:Prohormone-3 n=1 Tax=Hypsibius exemplaris TaxID=2072580 RepID=A0A1W0X310_HYPEX|nr:putative Prohormone-3 [Hypsibius exemplaris]
MPNMAVIVTFVIVLVVCLTVQPAAAWMGSMYRNREALRPDYDDDMPAFRGGGAPVARTGMWYQQRRSGANALEEDPPSLQEQQQAQNCKGLACRNDDGCCEAMVCKTPEPESKKTPVQLGTCIPNPNEGTACKQDANCGSGLECVLTAGARGFKTCQPKNRDISRKQYYDDCRQSMECDQVRGLCCQIQRRHRQAPRQVCSYYKDVQNCVGFRKGYMPEIDNSLTNMKNKWWQYRAL